MYWCIDVIIVFLPAYWRHTEFADTMNVKQELISDIKKRQLQFVRVANLHKHLMAKLESYMLSVSNTALWAWFGVLLAKYMPSMRKVCSQTSSSNAYVIRLFKQLKCLKTDSEQFYFIRSVKYLKWYYYVWSLNYGFHWYNKLFFV